MSTPVNTPRRVHQVNAANLPNLMKNSPNLYVLFRIWASVKVLTLDFGNPPKRSTSSLHDVDSMNELQGLVEVALAEKGKQDDVLRQSSEDAGLTATGAGAFEGPREKSELQRAGSDKAVGELNGAAEHPSGQNGAAPSSSNPYGDNGSPSPPMLDCPVCPRCRYIGARNL